MRVCIIHLLVLTSLGSTCLWASDPWGFPGDAGGKEPTCQCRRCKRRRFNPCVGKIPWRRAWQSTPVFLAWRMLWTEEPGGLQSIGSQRVWYNGSDLVHQTLNFSHLVGVLVSAEELQNVMCIAWEGTRTLPQSCFIVSCLFLPCLCIPSHPCFASVWNYRLELRDGHRRWVKLISCHQRIGGHRKSLCPGAPQGPAPWRCRLFLLTQTLFPMLTMIHAPPNPPPPLLSLTPQQTALCSTLRGILSVFCPRCHMGLPAMPAACLKLACDLQMVVTT